MTWLHLRLPMEFESSPACRCGTCSGPNVYGWQDWRTQDGDVLHPRFTPDFLAQERMRLGSLGYAGQMQQRPLPQSGGLFGIKCFARRWTRLPTHGRTVIALDASFKAGSGSDYAVIQVWMASGPDRYLVEQWRKQAGFSDTRDALSDVIKRYPFAKTLVEDAANGIAILDQLRREFPGIVRVKPIGGKRARAQSVQGIVESGAIVLPEHWPDIGVFLGEVCSFTGSGDVHDDQVDSMVYALRDLQDGSAVVGDDGFSSNEAVQSGAADSGYDY